MTNKRKDEYQQLNQIQINALCPYYAFEFPCPNLIRTDYCVYQHNRFARRTERLAAKLNEEGKEINELQQHILLTEKDGDPLKRSYNKSLWRKFPKYPSKEALKFLTNIFENTKFLEKHEIYEERERKFNKEVYLEIKRVLEIEKEV